MVEQCVGNQQPQNHQHHQHQRAQSTLHSCTPIFKSRKLANTSETGLVLMVVAEVGVLVGLWQGGGWVEG